MCGNLPPSEALLPGERLDDLQCGGYRLIQRPDAFRFGTDSVLLADFAAPRPRTRAVDLGCGTGAIATLMAAHEPTLQVDAVELQPDVADMARRSVLLNRLEGRMRVFAGDMREAHAFLGHGQYALAVCNPPYGRAGAALPSANEGVRLARHEGGLTAAGVAESAARLLKNGGRLCVIFPAPRALEMLRAMEDCRHRPQAPAHRTRHAGPRAEVCAHRRRARRRARGCTGCRRWCCARRTAPSALSGSASTACAEGRSQGVHYPYAAGGTQDALRPRMLRAEARISITPYTAGGSQDAPALRMPQAGARMPITPYATGKTQDTRHSVCHGQNPGYPSLRMPRQNQDTRHSVCHRRKLGRQHPVCRGRKPGHPVPRRRGRKYRKTPVCPAPARTRPGIWLPALPPHSVPDAFPRSHAPVLAPASQNHPPQARPL